MLYEYNKKIFWRQTNRNNVCSLNIFSSFSRIEYLYLTSNKQLFIYFAARADKKYNIFSILVFFLYQNVSVQNT